MHSVGCFEVSPSFFAGSGFDKYMYSAADIFWWSHDNVDWGQKEEVCFLPLVSTNYKQHENLFILECSFTLKILLYVGAVPNL